MWPLGLQRSAFGFGSEPSVAPWSTLLWGALEPSAFETSWFLVGLLLVDSAF